MTYFEDSCLTYEEKGNLCSYTKVFKYSETNHIGPLKYFVFLNTSSLFIAFVCQTCYEKQIKPMDEKKLGLKEIKRSEIGLYKKLFKIIK